MQAQQAPTFVYCSRILFLPFHQLLVIHKDNLTQPKKKKCLIDTNMHIPKIEDQMDIL